MQDPSDSMEIADPEKNGRSDTTDSPVADESTSDSDIDSMTTSTVLVEVLPGVAVVAGEVPPELKPDLIDFGIVPAADRKQISASPFILWSRSSVGRGWLWRICRCGGGSSGVCGGCARS